MTDKIKFEVPSSVRFCHIIPRGNEVGPMLSFREDGYAAVNLHKMLICPLEAVLPHELEAISRRAHINRGLNGNAPEGYTLANCIDEDTNHDR
ncbi:MAG: hypothetical protein ACOY7T_08175 [Pseudomonadota bacterium]